MKEEKKMTRDKYGEVLNGYSTYRIIARLLMANRIVGIGWTDGDCTHLDIIFSLGLDVKEGYFQRGIKQDDLFVSIIGYASYGFNSNTVKEGTYIQEKLCIQGECGDKVAELINGIIAELNELRDKDE